MLGQDNMLLWASCGNTEISGTLTVTQRDQLRRGEERKSWVCMVDRTSKPQEEWHSYRSSWCGFLRLLPASLWQGVACQLGTWRLNAPDACERGARRTQEWSNQREKGSQKKNRRVVDPFFQRVSSPSSQSALAQLRAFTPFSHCRVVLTGALAVGRAPSNTYCIWYQSRFWKTPAWWPWRFLTETTLSAFLLLLRIKPRLFQDSFPRPSWPSLFCIPTTVVGKCFLYK